MKIGKKLIFPDSEDRLFFGGYRRRVKKRSELEKMFQKFSGREGRKI